MSVLNTLEKKLADAFSPAHMEVINESHMHAGPPDAETHFNLTLVSDEFAGVRPVARHQSVYRVLAAELEGPVHALALHLYTGQEWQERSRRSPESPNCQGANKQ